MEALQTIRTMQWPCVRRNSSSSAKQASQWASCWARSVDQSTPSAASCASRCGASNPTTAATRANEMQPVDAESVYVVVCS